MFTEDIIKQTAHSYGLAADLRLMFEDTFIQSKVPLTNVTQKSMWNDLKTLQSDSVTFAAYCMLGKSHY